MNATAHRAPVSLAIGSTRVRFIWRHDRWAHEILFPDGTAWQSLEGPVAGGGDPRWPASPVLVELSRLDRPTGAALLGVGLAGRSHFSASVGPDPVQSDCIRFEIACRVVDAPPWLGSTYVGPRGIVRIAPHAAAIQPPATLQWGYAIAPQGLLPLGGARVDITPAAEGPHLAIAPPIDQIHGGSTRPPGTSACSTSSSGSRPTGPTSTS